MSTAPNPNYALASFAKEANYSYSELLSDGHDVTTRMGNTALKLYRGTIAKVDPTTGAVTVAAPFNCVVAENCDGTVTPAACLVYMTGKMKADAVIWPGAVSHSTVTDQLRDYGIYIESVLYIDGTFVKSAPTQTQEEKAKARIEYNKAHAGETPAGDKPDLKGDLTDSAWGHLTEEERNKNPELMNALPVSAPEKDKEAAMFTPPHDSTKDPHKNAVKTPLHDDKGGKR